MNYLEIIGIISAVVELGAFIANQYGKIDSDNIWYDVINFVCGIGLTSYALSINALPFIITNSIWALVSFVDVAKYFFSKKI
ncbi:MAG: hypothetical protein WCF92_03945 [bacterium]